MSKTQIYDIEHDEYFIDLINSIEVGILLMDPLCSANGEILDYAILEFNTALERIFNITRKNVISKPITGSYLNIGSEFFDLLHQTLKAGGTIQSDIYFNIEDKYYIVKAKTLLNGHLISFFYDVTGKVKAEKATEKHLMLFENAQDIILYLRADGNIMDANKTAINIYGYSYQELIKMNIQQLRHVSMKGDYMEHMEASAFKGVVFEGTHVRKDGTSFPVEVSSRSVNVMGELYRIHIIRDITERKEAEEKIRYLANYDALTGIANRGFLMSLLKETLELSTNDNLKFAVMLFDVDKFKSINDMYGHNTGDKVLRTVAQRLQQAAKKPHIVGRLGGDEFLVIQKDIANKDEVFALAKGILETLCKSLELNGISLDLSISLGVAIYPEASENAEGLIQCADSTMYSVKQKGGGSFKVYGN